jgi:hypothetical protein
MVDFAAIAKIFELSCLNTSLTPKTLNRGLAEDLAPAGKNPPD